MLSLASFFNNKTLKPLATIPNNENQITKSAATSTGEIKRF